jgi:DNA-binding transcriptional MerR regulator
VELTYTTKQLARISGISKRQLIRWDQVGLLHAERGRVRGKTADRAYTRAQAIGVIALAELRRNGVSQRRIRAASGVLPEAIEEGGFLVFDGWMIYPRSTAEDAISMVEEKPGSLVMRVSKLMARLSS